MLKGRWEEQTPGWICTMQAMSFLCRKDPKLLRAVTQVQFMISLISFCYDHKKCHFINILCASGGCVPFNGGNSALSSLPWVPLTSKTQLMEKLPCRTSSVLSALWRHCQRKLGAPPFLTCNTAFFLRRWGSKEIPATAQCVGEAGSAHQSKPVPAQGVTRRWGSTRPSPLERLLFRPRREAGEHLLHEPDLVSIRLLHQTPYMCLQPHKSRVI